MEKAEDSDGFDSCEELDDPSHRTGNPFKDFALDIQDIKDEEILNPLKFSRKMIVDWIESGKDTDLDGWKPIPVKNKRIQAFSNLSNKEKICQRLHIQIPNCKLDDIMPYLIDIDKRKLYDEGLETYKSVKKYPLNTEMVYAKLKTIWPIG